MSWHSRYRWQRFLGSSLWALPVGATVLALLVAPLMRWLDNRTQWTLLGFGPDGAKALVGSLSGALLTLIVFAFSILLLAVQVSGSQLSPRAISRVFESRLSRSTLAAFVFSYTYSLAALGRIEARVPQLPVLLVVLSSLLGILLFIGLIQAAGSGLRPASVLSAVADDTRAVIDALYPPPFVPGAVEGAEPGRDTGRPARTIEHGGRGGVLVAFDSDGLVEVATRTGCEIELVPQVGDFLATGDALFRIYGAGAVALDERLLRRSFVLGRERRLEQDPAFGLRIIVEIASKALSPAINDPTTGVLAIDQLEHLLHLLSHRQLDSGVVKDSSGAVRLVYRAPEWEDFVALAATEIRLYGATSPQIPRRLRAMFEQLLRVVPAERTGAIKQELALLQSTIDQSFADPEDRRRAAIADLQGFGSRAAAADGGSRETSASSRSGA